MFIGSLSVYLSNLNSRITLTPNKLANVHMLASQLQLSCVHVQSIQYFNVRRLFSFSPAAPQRGALFYFFLFPAIQNALHAWIEFIVP